MFIQNISIRKIANKLDVAKSTVSDIWKLFQQIGDIKERNRPGKSKITDARQISTLNANHYQIKQELLLIFREMLISGKELRYLFGHSEKDSETLGCGETNP